VPLAVTELELQQLLDEVEFTHAAGFAVHAIADGECTIAVPFQSLFERPGGIIGGQIFMAAADVAMWLAIKTRLGLHDASVTAEMKTNFLNAAARQDFRCTARVLKFGSRLIYGVAECTAFEGHLLTHHTITYISPP
jgi:acyl-coenzyme A thioesterase PaaI-like protein